MNNEKQKAALSSVFAAVFLTILKVIVGIVTGSLGIISEALHSILDLAATVITFFAVRFSDKPADAQHHYGHGKMESFSALIETLLLLITCIWIIYEAAGKLFFGKSVEMTGAFWGVLVMVISIAVNASRVVVLKRAAKKYQSQALQADALHFDSDIWSSAVVTVGLICVWLGDALHIDWLKYADPVAALGVAILVIKVSVKLGKETIEVLLDTAPQGMKEMIEKELTTIPVVVQIEAIRIRASGAVKYIDLNVGVEAGLDQSAVHQAAGLIRARINELVPGSDVFVSTFPIDLHSSQTLNINRTLERIVDQSADCLNVHNVHIYDHGQKKHVTAHIELRDNLPLSETHKLSHQISSTLKEQISAVENVNLYFERAEKELEIEDITDREPAIVAEIKTTVDEISANIDCHDIRLYQNGENVSTFLHCGVKEEFTLDKLELLSDIIKKSLKQLVSQLDHVHIHFEPVDSDSFDSRL